MINRAIDNDKRDKTKMINRAIDRMINVIKQK